MAKIKLLPPHEAHKIAAGQVVERPCNAVKELLENSIDAGATRITVYIEDGGKQLIRVVDNGCGMDQQDAQLCLEKHATSKINSIDDLPFLHSYGFRGEALASIAAVATVKLTTKETGKTEGCSVIAEHGKISSEITACPEGTDITITNLFRSIPARAKFLKKRETETNHIMQIMHAMSLAYPQYHFQLYVDGHCSLNYPPQEHIINRSAQIWGPQTARHLITIEPSEPHEDIAITGAISNHAWFRYDRRTMFFLVNNRWVTNQHLARALIKGYDNVIPHGRYPTAIISIAIDPAQIDINTHPKKEEIVFEHPRHVEQLIYKVVRSTLEKAVSKQIGRTVSFASSQPVYAYPGLPARQASSDSAICFDSKVESVDCPKKPKATTGRIVESPQFFATELPRISQPFIDGKVGQDSMLPIDMPPTPYTMPTFSEPSFTKESNFSATSYESAMPTSAIPHPGVSKEISYRLIGQLHQTYLLIEQEEGLYLIDQHAAHERILYELFAHRFQDVPTIPLMFPQIISCDQHDIALIEPHLHLFHEHGIAIEPFGKDQLMIQSTPVHLKHTSLQELVDQVIGWIRDYQTVDQETFIKTMHDKLRAQMACKAAVKAGDTLSILQMQELLDDLYVCPNRFSCPHGRPTGWIFPFHDIEKRFKRR